jgi:regulator of RNase E activity RraA/CMP-N-acetylneuraminic acid synthetase
VRVVAFVPAKGSSQRVDDKNVRLLDGTPLVLHTLHKILKCTTVDEVFLDTESQKIADLARHLPVRVLWRNPDLATNATDGHELFVNQVAQVDADIYVQSLCTAPFVHPETVDRAVRILKEDPSYDSVVLVRKDKQYTWSEGTPDYGTARIPNSVDLPETVIEAMSLYVVRKSAVQSTKRRFGNRTYLLEASPLEAIDVNTPAEFELADFIASGLRERERVILRLLRTELSSAMLSDILDDIGCNTAISGLAPFNPSDRILGRARTLSLRPLEDGEDFHGIYDALKSYDFVVPNDVLLVANKVPQYAYFGDLNARLALRAGAVGAIIDGVTRDTQSVRQLGLPVFARGAFCADVRKRATVEDMNCPIEIGGQPVAPGDLVFADADGVIIIPRKYELQVIDQAMETLAKEHRITLDIVRNLPADQILSRSGAF